MIRKKLHPLILALSLAFSSGSIAQSNNISNGQFSPVSNGSPSIENTLTGSSFQGAMQSPIGGNTAPQSSADSGNNAVGPGGFDGDTEQVERHINGILDFPVSVKGDNVEYAHKWFRQILGGFIFAPWSEMDNDPDGAYDPDEQTVLAKALGFTNILAIILCLVIGYYLIVGGAINTASKGEVLGKNWDGPWLALRTSIGFGMLVPLKGIGGLTLSFSQVAVIWLIMIGSNSATILWNFVGKSIMEGTPIVSPDLKVSASDVLNIGKMTFCAQVQMMNSSIVHSNSVLKETGYQGTGERFNASFEGGTKEVREANPLNMDKSDRAIFSINYSGRTVAKDIILADKFHPNKAAYNKALYRSKNDIKIDKKRHVKSINYGIDGSCGTIMFPHYQAKTVSHQQGDRPGESKLTTVVDADHNSVKATSYKSDAIIAGGQKYAEIVVDITNKIIEFNDRFLHKSSSSGLYENGNPAAKIYQLITEENSAGENTDNGGKIEEKMTYSSMKAYSGLPKIIRYYQKSVNTKVLKAVTGSKDFKSKMMEEMLKGGWAGAGIWFIELSSIPSLPYQVVTQVTDSISYSPSSICALFGQNTSVCDVLEKELNSYSAILDNIVKESARSGNSSFNVTSSDYDNTICGIGGQCENPQNVSDRKSVEIAKGLLGILGQSDENSALDPLGGGLASPFLYLAEVGQTLNNTAYVALGGIIAINTATQVLDGYSKKIEGTLLGVAADLTGASLLTHGIYAVPLAIMKNTAMVAVSGLMVVVMSAIMSGFVLAYVIPFMPITTWILMMAGYMLTVVEAIAAAPLAIVLLFTPEGSGIAGSRFERALNLVAMAILRPSFMIIGLISAITVSFVAFGMMNQFFFKAAEHLLAGHMFDAIAVMLLYTSTAYQLCKMMVENMHQLPDRIGEWFAGGVSRQFGESRINDSAEQSVQGAAGAFKSMPGQMMTMQSSMKDTQDRLKGIEDTLNERNK